MFVVRSQVWHTGFELTQADDAWLLAAQITRFQNTQPLAYNPRRSPTQFSHQNCEPLPRSAIQPGLNCESHVQIVLQAGLCMTYRNSHVRTGHLSVANIASGAKGSLTSAQLLARLRAMRSVCPFVPLRLHAIGSRASGPWAVVDSPPSIQLLSLGRRVAQDHRHHRTRASSGKDPPKPWAVELDPDVAQRANQSETVRSLGAGSPSAGLGSSLRNQVVNIAGGLNCLRSGGEGHVCH